jgi:hypothetical protein
MIYYALGHLAFFPCLVSWTDALDVLGDTATVALTYDVLLAVHVGVDGRDVLQAF